MKVSSNSPRLHRLCSFASALVLAGTVATKATAQEILTETSQADNADLLKWHATPRPARPKIGLALGGGGFRGAAEVGVMEVLDKERIKFDYITGTSIGSIVGGLYDAGVPMATLREEFESGRAMRHFLPVPLPVGLLLEPAMLAARLCGSKPYDGLYYGKFFYDYLKKLTPENAKTIQNLKTPFAAVGLNLVDGKPYMIRGGSLPLAMKASSAVPGLRKPVPIGNKLFVDGGVVCNVPVKQCREMGADIVIAVDIDIPWEDMPQEKFRRAGTVSKRMINWDLYSNDKPQDDLADVVIHPDTTGIGLVMVSRATTRKAVEIGRKAAESALPLIREKLRSASASSDGPASGL